MNKNIGNWIKSRLVKYHPHVNWHSGMSVKLVNYLLRQDCKGEHYISKDDNGNLAIYERDY